MMSARTGLAILALISAVTVARAQSGTVNWQHAREVDVVMTNFAFTPNALELRAGVPYRLHLVNNGSSGHSFTDKALFAASQVDPEDANKVVDGSIEVPKGQTVDVRFVATKPGRYPFHCSHFLHASFGMTGVATVN